MRMKTSMNLSINSDTGRKAKQWAQEHNTSLSSMVEAYLEQVTSAEEPSFSQKWQGKFKVKNVESPRSEYLRKRYSL
jgi:hypothetical protein